MKVFLLLLSSLMVAACASHPGQPSTAADLPARPSEGLVGQWRYADSTQSCYYVFQKNGNFSGEVEVQGKRVSQFSGRWTVRDDHLLYRYTNDSMGLIAPGSRDQDKLLAVSQNFFIIEAGDGSKRRYRRIR